MANSSMHKKSILIIICITFITYVNVLQNDFVGDDEIIIERNNFYKSWNNFHRLFQKSYITQSDNALLALDQDNHSGSVAYRPVLSLTYFVDFGIWKKNPFGYHFTNIVLHTLNAILVYGLIYFVSGAWPPALLGSLIFSIHPVQAEAVCNIGYRADPLAAFFALLSFLCFIRLDAQYMPRASARGSIAVLARGHATGKWRPEGSSLDYYPIPRRNLLYGLSLLFFFLALFSKESVIVLPALMIGYDFYFREGALENFWKNFWQRYLGYIGIVVFYLYVYFYVFPNSTLTGEGGVWMGGTLVTHAVKIGLIFLFYIKDLTMPFFVAAIPPVYSPPVDPGWGYQIFIALVVLVLSLFFICRGSRKQKAAPFFLLWFFIALLPVAQIVPIVTPMAHRFLYLPAVGFFAVLAAAIEAMAARLAQNHHGPRLGIILKNGVVAACIIATFILNASWRGNYTIARHWIEHYPQHPYGYFIVGIQYMKAGWLEPAKMAFEKSLALGMEDPRLYQSMGLLHLQDPPAAKKFFAKSVELFPSYAISYVGLGRSLLFEGDYTKALLYLEKSLELMPTYKGYGYLIQTLIFLDRGVDLPEIFQAAQKILTDKNQIDSLNKFMNLTEPLHTPIDIGL